MSTPISFDEATFWLMTSASLFNAMLMTTLGAMTLLTATRRSAGAWLAGFGLLLGGAFFAAHAALLDYSLRALVMSVRSWWFFGWSVLIALPVAWYGLMLWCAGFWDDARSRLYRLHRYYFAAAFVAALLLSAGIALLNPLHALRSAAQMMLDETPTSSEYSMQNATLVFFAIFAIYAIYALSCMALALDVVRRPFQGARLMSDAARRRARPWLLVSSLLLLLVSALFCSGLFWLALHAWHGDLAMFGGRSFGGVLWSLDWFDALVCLLIGGAVVSLGKALVSFDVFASGALPRGLLWRGWRRVVASALMCSVLLTTALWLELRPVFIALLGALAMGGSFALLQWRAAVERDKSLAHIEQFFRSSSEELSEDGAPSITFTTLCRDVLDAREAHLFALNTLAPLVANALHFPREAVPDTRVLTALHATPLSDGALCFSLEHEDAMFWAVPLHSARGVIGVLLLGERNSRALYTQEEMEMARSVCERLLETRAAAALSRQLMELQGQKMRENFVLENRARRTLHDDILPQIHAAMLSLGADASTQDATQMLAATHKDISDLLRAMPLADAPQLEKRGLCGALRHVAEKELAGAFSQINFSCERNVSAAFDTLPPLHRETLFYAAREAMRNAARHAAFSELQKARLEVAMQQSESALLITIEDDGRGQEAAREYSQKRNNAMGGGNGLALHSTMMAVIGGTLSLQNVVPHGTRVVLELKTHETKNATQKEN